ncbi:hypothetical protein [Terrisporobacter petrolearius]|uniref:hypothetical protein n=1 Tax=Terrisporobacter petrolearius TaxID=1460447 RepID=UPI003AFFE9D1
MILITVVTSQHLYRKETNDTIRYCKIVYNDMLELKKVATDTKLNTINSNVNTPKYQGE